MFGAYHPQSNGIQEKFYSFLNACIRKHIHGKLDWEDTIQILLFSLRILPSIESKESPFYLLFSRGHLNPLRKLLSPNIRYQGDGRGLLDVEATRYSLALGRKNICLSRQRSDKDHSITRSSDKFKVADLYVKRHALSSRDSKWESRFCIIKFSTPDIAILESTLNG